MGAGSSSLANNPNDKIDFATFKGLMNQSKDKIFKDEVLQRVFKAYSDGDGKMSQFSIAKLSEKTDIYISHDWGFDDVGRDHREYASKFNQSLKDQGYITWFDADRLKIEIDELRSYGVRGTQVVMILISKNYVDKVTKKDSSDACFHEFLSITKALEEGKTLTLDNIIPIVIESKMLDSSSWTGDIGKTITKLVSIFQHYSSRHHCNIDI